MLTDVEQFLLWEKATTDTIDFKKVYVDIAGDILAGLVLSEIVYWHLPRRDGASKLRIEHNGIWWIAIRRSEWWERTRMTPRQADRALNILIDKGIVAKDVFKFNGEPTTHVALVWQRFLPAFREKTESPSLSPLSPNGDNEITDKVNTKSPTGENDLPYRGSPVTEVTTEIKNLPLSAVAASPQVSESALGVQGFSDETGLRGDPEEPQKRIRKQKPEQTALCKLIRRNIGKFVQKLAEELELRLELYSMRYDDDPLYREFIEKVIVPQWVFVNEKGQTIHLATRAEAVQGIIESEDQWTAYQVKHQPEANPFEGMSSTEIQRYLEGPVVTPLPPPLNFQDPA